MIGALLTAALVLSSTQAETLPARLVIVSPAELPFTLEELKRQTQPLSFIEKHRYQFIKSDEFGWLTPIDPCGLEGARSHAALCQELAKNPQALLDGQPLLNISPASRKALLGELARNASRMSEPERSAMARGEVPLAFSVDYGLGLTYGGKRLQVTMDAFDKSPQPRSWSTNESQPPVSDAELKEQGQSGYISSRHVSHFQVTYGGNWPVSERFKQSAKLFDYLAEQAQAAENLVLNSNSNLAAVLLQTGSGLDLHVAKGTQFSALDPEVKRRIERDVVNSWEAYGFESKHEAELFLINATVAGFSRSVNVSNLTDRGSRSSMPFGHGWGGADLSGAP